jgi:beta-galactosidase
VEFFNSTNHNSLYLLHGAIRKTGLFLLLLIIASASPIISQPLLLTRNSPDLPQSYLNNLQNDQRKIINLNGVWDISADMPTANTIQVPFCYDFKGKISCSRKFDVPFDNPRDWNYIICADGINYQCEIKVNGSFIMKHEGGFSPFSSPLAEGIIKESGNIIEIKVDNSLDVSRTLPLKNTANYPKNYGGIYRDIYILAVPKIFVKSANVVSEIDINLNADLNNSITISATDISKFPGDKKLTVMTELLDTGGTVKASSDAAAFVVSSNSTVLAVNKLSVTTPVYWSPEIPHLYKLKVTIYYGEEIIDTYQTDFGIYELVRKSGTIVLNRAEFKFKGLNYIEEFGGKGICASYDDIERDIKNIKSLGCNIIKVYGRPASPYLIELCNEYGLLVMEEIPVFTVPAGILETENFLQLAENQLIEMITSHKNNPCIFAYGLGNDFDVTGAAGQNYVKRLMAETKDLDNRFMYYSTRNYFNDKCRDLVDLVGINFYDNDLSVLKNIAADVKLKKDKIFISNYGKYINPSNTAGYSDPNSLEAQSKYIVDLYKLYKSSPFAGGFFHSYTDWNSDFPNLKSLDPTNQYMRTSGLYTLFREQRPPAIIIRKEFLDEDIPNLNIGTFTKESPLVFVFTGLITFILFIYLANSVRRFRENVWRALFRPFIFYTDVREQNLIPTFHNILLAIILSIGMGLFFANLLYFWKDSQMLDIMLSVLISQDSIKIFIDQYISNPLKLTGLLAAIAFIKIFVIAFIIWLFSLTIKYRVGFNNIYTITVWGLLPTVVLLAIGTFYIRILQANSDFVTIGLGTVAVLYALSLYRILKGTYLLFDTFFLKVYAYGIITIAVILGGTWFYLNTTKYAFDYFRLVMTFLKG